MLSRVHATCISSKEYFKGVNLSEFIYTQCNRGSIKTKSEFEVITEDLDFKLAWKIEQTWAAHSTAPNRWICTWKKISLDTCDQGLKVDLKISIDKVILLDRKVHSSFVEENLKIACPQGIEINMLVDVYRENTKTQIQLENYKFLLEIKKFNDVTFLCAKERFPAHMAILSARSPVFRSMFDSDMVDKNNGEIIVTDTEPYIFKDLLKFIYCGSIESSSVDDLLKLFVATDKYCVKQLTSICKRQIFKNLSPKCVADILITADLVRDNLLKKECMNYILEHKNEVTRTKSYDNFVKTRPDLLSELFRAY